MRKVTFKFDKPKWFYNILWNFVNTPMEVEYQLSGDPHGNPLILEKTRAYLDDIPGQTNVRVFLCVGDVIADRCAGGRFILNGANWDGKTEILLLGNHDVVGVYAMSDAELPERLREKGVTFDKFPVENYRGLAAFMPEIIERTPWLLNKNHHPSRGELTELETALRPLLAQAKTRGIAGASLTSHERGVMERMQMAHLHNGNLFLHAPINPSVVTEFLDGNRDPAETVKRLNTIVSENIHALLNRRRAHEEFYRLVGVFLDTDHRPTDCGASEIAKFCGETGVRRVIHGHTRRFGHQYHLGKLDCASLDYKAGGDPTQPELAPNGLSVGFLDHNGALHLGEEEIRARRSTLPPPHPASFSPSCLVPTSCVSPLQPNSHPGRRI